MKEIRRLNQIAQVIYDKKGANIIALDVRELSTLTEYFILAEGDVERHVSAIARAVIDQQLTQKHSPFHVEGLQNGDWVVVDYGHIMVHIFHPDLRERYALETLWRYGKIVDLDIKPTLQPDSSGEKLQDGVQDSTIVRRANLMKVGRRGMDRILAPALHLSPKKQGVR